jgi:hypothetical protein
MFSFDLLGISFQTFFVTFFSIRLFQSYVYG